uniref:Zinc knuckle CX2CX4HX4C n=1 Tax=Tanacetum cinerariifolium TaxID=118510 RepID=A0A6L2P3A5_TANCI|nr:zinc knuckle CX2CX4HX4C [Tanacetum cinerariifolium]
MERIESRIVINHLAKIKGYPTYGRLKRLKENHAKDLEQLGILNVVVARMFGPYSNPHIGANMSQEKFFDATAMNVQSTQTKDMAGGYVFNSTPMDSYGMPATRVNLVESGVTSDGSPKLINDTEAGKHDELLSGMTNDDRIETMDTLGPVFDGVNIFVPRKVVKKVSTRFENTLYGYFIGKRMAFLVVEYYARNNWVKHGLKRIMINSKGFFFFKFNYRVGLEAILEGGPWLIHGISLIATFIGKPVMLNSYTSSMYNELLGRSSFVWCLIEINPEADFVDVVAIGIPYLSGDGFTKETIGVVSFPIVTTSNVVTPTFEKTNDGFQTLGKKRRGKRTGNSSNKDNLSMSNSFSTLNDEEDVENVYHESAILIQNTKAGGSSSFMAVAGDGALGSLGALKASTHHVITMFLYPLRAVEAACALEVDAMKALDPVEAVGALDLVEVEAVVALDVVGLSLNIIISASLRGYLTSLY